MASIGSTASIGITAIQQNAETGLTRRRLHQPFFVKGLQDNGGGGKGQDHADGQGHFPFKSEIEANKAEGGGGYQHLQSADADDGSAQAPQQ